MRFLVLLLVACSGTPKESPQPRPAPPPPIDAAVDATPPVDAELAFLGPCDWNKPDPKNPRCAPENMPLMPCRAVGGPNDRFPKCIPDKQPVVEVKPIVLAIKRHGEPTERGIPIVVDGGTNRGIDKTWRALLVDKKDKPVAGGNLSITRLDPDEIEGLAKITPDQLELLVKAVRFSPPAN